jgi:hypothetical protein
MRCNANVFSAALRLVSGSILLMVMTSSFGQVSPVEILNPRLKADEQKYLAQLQSLQQSIAAAKFPFPFRLARYLYAKPGQRAALDSNGIEFVYFQHRVVLKVSGIYKVAFNSTQLSENERASRTLQDVVVPILRLVTQQIPPSADCDGIGFEIVYDTRDANMVYDYEGQEVLAVVFSRDDAFAYANATEETERQQLLNRSNIFVDGKDFGLALGQRDPLNVQALERSAPRQAGVESSSMPATTAPAVVVSGTAVSPTVLVAQSKAASNSPPTSGDAMRLQERFQPQLNAIVKEDGTRLHLVERATPSFEIYGNQTVLRFTMRNTLSFERSTTSIYKRAAQSFDLFLAPELKELSRKLPADAEYDALDFSVLNHIGAEKTSSETIDYICPLNSVRSFVENKITSQDLINQSIVLVNGVRISLDLQLVE